jgi:Na+/H+ antiporter NhaD/arsenite permease-like protein
MRLPLVLVEPVERKPQQVLRLAQILYLAPLHLTVVVVAAAAQEMFPEAMEVLAVAVAFHLALLVHLWAAQEIRPLRLHHKGIMEALLFQAAIPDGHQVVVAALAVLVLMEIITTQVTLLLLGRRAAMARHQQFQVRQ